MMRCESNLKSSPLSDDISFNYRTKRQKQKIKIINYNINETDHINK